MKSAEALQADFDRIAQFSDESSWSHNSHYHHYLMRQLPNRIETALEVGCGTGAFARQLAERCKEVHAIDLSPEMIRLAKARSSAYPNITFEVADVLETALPDTAFDCIVSIATLHHMPLEVILPRLKSALKEGGVLLVLDLYAIEDWRDYVRSAVALPLDRVLKVVKNSSAQSSEAKAAWAQHGDEEVYPRVSDVRILCNQLLPDAMVRKHLFWRYSLVWKKQAH